MWLIMALAACNQGSVSDSVSEADQDPGINQDPDANPDAPREPEPYLPSEEVEPLQPEMSPQAIGDAVIDVLGTPSQLVPVGLDAAVTAMMAAADDTCPSITRFQDESGVDVMVWYDDCTTASGATFRGGLELRRTIDAVGDFGEVRNAFNLFLASTEINLPDGRWLAGGGGFGQSLTEAPTYSYIDSYASGRVETDADTAGSDPWLLGERSGNLYVGVTVGDGFASLYANGSFPMPADSPVIAVALDDVSVTGGCTTEPFGTVALREPNGVWHDLVFADYDEEQQLVLDCDGCGTHFVSGVAQPDGVCLDQDQVAGLLDFGGGLPW